MIAPFVVNSAVPTGKLALLIVLVLLGAFAIEAVWRVRASIRRRAHGSQATVPELAMTAFIGGLRFHATGGIASGLRYNATWPLARLEVSKDQITISLRGRAGPVIARTLRRDFPAAATLRPDEVRIVETDFGPSSAKGFRFRTLDPDDPRDGVVFWTHGGDRQKIAPLLEGVGFRLPSGSAVVG